MCERHVGCVLKSITHARKSGSACLFYNAGAAAFRPPSKLPSRQSAGAVKLGRQTWSEGTRFGVVNVLCDSQQPSKHPFNRARFKQGSGSGVVAKGRQLQLNSCGFVGDVEPGLLQVAASVVASSFIKNAVDRFGVGRKPGTHGDSSAAPAPRRTKLW